MGRKHFHSNGKLLLSGEYLVLKGSVAFALPVKYSQSLDVISKQGPPALSWKTLIRNNEWFSAEFLLPQLEILSCNNEAVAKVLQKILMAALELKPFFFNKSKQFEVVANLDFEINWGLGSSSSLISNIAWWFDVDPYILSKSMGPGSGYDIACARSEKALLYQLVNGQPQVKHIDFDPGFKKSILFIYRGKKQDTRESISQFIKGSNITPSAIQEVSSLSLEMAQSESVGEFINVIQRSESLMADVLGRPAVKNELFPDFPGAVKSLGAWGGDFVMAASEAKPSAIKDYFKTKGFETIFSYDEMIP